MNSRLQFRRMLAAGLVLSACWLVGFQARAEALPGVDKQLKAELKSTIDVGLTYLRSLQESNGSWSDSPLVTALVLRALMESPRRYVAEDGPFVRGALRYLSEMAKPSGSIDNGERPLVSTAAALIPLQASANPDHAAIAERGRSFLVEALMSEEGPPSAGGRIELQELALILEALETGGPPDAEAASQRVVEFIKGCFEAPMPCEAIAEPQDLYAAAGILLRNDAGSAREQLADTIRDVLFPGLEQAENSSPPALFHLAAALRTHESLEPATPRLANRVMQLQQPEGFWAHPPFDESTRGRTMATALAILAMERIYAN